MAPGGKTVLNENVDFVLGYPTGKGKDSNTYTLYRFDEKGFTEIAIEALDDGIHASSNQFHGTGYDAQYILLLNSKLTGTVSLSTSTPRAGETITATANAYVAKEKYTGDLEYRWVWVDEETDEVTPITGNNAKYGEFSKNNFSYQVGSADLMHILRCEVRCAPVAGDDSIPTNSIYATSNRVRIDTYELYNTTSENNYNSGYFGYFKGVTSDMEYCIDGGSWRNVSTAGNLTGNELYVKTPGVYLFRHPGADAEYWDGGEIEAWYVIGYQISNSSTDSGSGTVTFRNGSTPLTSSTTIYSDSTRKEVIIKPNGTNQWLVKAGANTDITVTVTPASGVYAHVSVNGGAYQNSSSTITLRFGTITENKAVNVTFNRSSSSPQTGDMSNLGLWSALCFMSLVGTATILTGVRKRKNAEK